MTEIVQFNEPKPPTTPAAKPSSEPSAEINFALVLSRTIDSVRQNPGELRAAVYELARIKLKEQFGSEDAREVERLTAALEDAIQGVESFSNEEDGRRSRPLANGAQTLLPLAVESEAPMDATARSAWPPQRPAAAKTGFATFGSLARFAVILLVVAGAVAAIALWPRLRSLAAAGRAERLAQSRPAPVTVAAKSVTASMPARAETPALPFPVPTRFGVYAISNDQLQELKALPGKVPDVRVSVSAAINTPSATTLSDNRPKFIVFRRDGAISAPDRIEARLVARVTRAMAVDTGGKAKLTPEQDAWVIRNIAVPYGVGPVDDQHPDMYLIQPEAADPLPAGRYALVLKGVGFDFTVDGPVTDPRQCMERVDAVNGAFYSPCPQPDTPRKPN